MTPVNKQYMYYYIEKREETFYTENEMNFEVQPFILVPPSWLSP
jgi:hypothetical protein